MVKIFKPNVVRVGTNQDVSQVICSESVVTKRPAAFVEQLFGIADVLPVKPRPVHSLTATSEAPPYGAAGARDAIPDAVDDAREA